MTGRLVSLGVTRPHAVISRPWLSSKTLRVQDTLRKGSSPLRDASLLRELSFRAPARNLALCGMPHYYAYRHSERSCLSASVPAPEARRKDGTEFRQVSPVSQTPHFVRGDKAAYRHSEPFPPRLRRTWHRRTGSCRRRLFELRQAPRGISQTRSHRGGPGRKGRTMGAASWQ